MPLQAVAAGSDLRETRKILAEAVRAGKAHHSSHSKDTKKRKAADV